VTFVVRTVSKENTFKGAVGEFIFSIGAKVRETRTPEHSEMREVDEMDSSEGSFNPEIVGSLRSGKKGTDHGGNMSVFTFS
ncbi:unnamed protein product, partial [Prunus brigantina]